MPEAREDVGTPHEELGIVRSLHCVLLCKFQSPAAGMAAIDKRLQVHIKHRTKETTLGACNNLCPNRGTGSTCSHASAPDLGGIAAPFPSRRPGRDLEAVLEEGNAKDRTGRLI